MNKRVYITVLTMLYALWLCAQQAPGFRVTDIQGLSHDLYKDYLDKGKYVVLEIFFSNNPGSNNIAHDYYKLYESWGQGQFDIQFLALTNKDFDNNIALTRFTQRYRSSLPHISADGGSLEAIAPYIDGQFGKIFLLPAFILIKPNGTVIYNIKGVNDLATLQLIDSILLAEGLEKPYLVTGKVTAYENPLEAVDITAQDSTKKTAIRAITDQLGEYTCIFRSKPDEQTLYIQPFKNSRSDFGVSSIDLTVIARHILNIQPFTDGWQYIAADIDRNKTINALDLVLLRKLILGIDTAFQNNTSWRFYPQNYFFEKPEDALLSEFPESIRYLDMLDPQTNTPDFVGVKIGDINGTSNKINDPSIRNKNTVSVKILQTVTKEKQMFKIRPETNQSLAGFQFAITLSPWTSIKIISNLPGFSQDHYYFRDHTVYFTYYSPDNILVSPSEDLITIETQMLTIDDLQLSPISSFQSEWYDEQLLVKDLQFTIEKTWRSVYPNPCLNEIQIPSDLVYESINIYNLQGSLIKSVQQPNSPTLDVSNLPKGTYILNLTRGPGDFMQQKIIKL